MTDAPNLWLRASERSEVGGAVQSSNRRRPLHLLGQSSQLVQWSIPGPIDSDGCLVCPWHQAKYEVSTGRMVRGPQGVFAKVPGLEAGYKALTKVWPLARGTVERRGTDLTIN